MHSVTSETHREIGRVISISNIHVRVQLATAPRSQVRSTPDRVAVVSQLGAYTLFPTRPGELAVGIVVGATEEETIEGSGGLLALHLGTSRRVLRVNLVGQLRSGSFEPGVTAYPILGTPSLLPDETELKAILSVRSSSGFVRKLDAALGLGRAAVYSNRTVEVSFNDLYSRPFAVIGNTGSGKSCSVATLIQQSLRKRSEGHPTKAKFVLLDVNGEYSTSFGASSAAREINTVYIDGAPFTLPLWTFNLKEAAALFSGKGVVQGPILERVLTAVREDTLEPGRQADLRDTVRKLENCLHYIDRAEEVLQAPTAAYCGDKLKQICSHLSGTLHDLAEITIPGVDDGAARAVDADYVGRLDVAAITQHHIPHAQVQAFVEACGQATDAVQELHALTCSQPGFLRVTADTPIPFDPVLLRQSKYFASVISRYRGEQRIHEYVATLRLRIGRILADRRWQVFTRPQAMGSLDDVFARLLGEDENPVTVVDCSMLAHDVLPYFCGVLARLLLDLRTQSNPASRVDQPYVVVLEEAHNYTRGWHANETDGSALSREAFERIAKEGRKFGLSLVIASQRPSDISATVLSQCANFLAHRIQNPEDIEYFRRILPLGSRDLLDQLPVLAPGEGLFMGSAINVPARVRLPMPDPKPQSATSAPWRDWQDQAPIFDRISALDRWLQREGTPQPVTDEAQD